MQSCSNQKHQKPNVIAGMPPNVPYQENVQLANWCTERLWQPKCQGKTETYVDLQRWYKHEGDFKNSRRRTSTELSIHIWDLKDRNIPYSISWEVVRRAQTFSLVTNKCDLCIHEKFEILYNKISATPNKRNEIFNHCRHKKKLLLGKWAWRRKRIPGE